mmetsp:Transcript_5796/g.9632  ORF Transcript_5796/g.9632 Transcript_5796/m.9632 type:complete len:96 (-) Transcript_5796:246-533(-)
MRSIRIRSGRERQVLLYGLARRRCRRQANINGHFVRLDAHKQETRTCCNDTRDGFSTERTIELNNVEARTQVFNKHRTTVYSLSIFSFATEDGSS